MFIPTTFRRVIRIFYDREEAFLKKLRKQGAVIGNNVQIVDRFNFLYEPWYANLIELHDGVVISAGVRFVLHDSSYANVFGDLPTKFGKIIIGENSYIGVNTIVLCGVRIGKSCIIGAGSVVNKDIPDFSIAAGNPVRIIGDVHEGLFRYKERIKNGSQKFVYYINFGGSYAQIKKLHGKSTFEFIIEKYNEFFKEKAL
jgi:acetyltransferase-like isoleucine patch superfamily enzyme